MSEHDGPPPRIPPEISDENRAYWTGGSEGRLMMSFCGDCSRFFHPPASVCPRCGGPAAPRAVSGRGSLYTFTVNRHPYHPVVPPPYIVAIVELEEQAGLKFTTNLVNCAVDDAEIGMAVRVVFEQTGDAWVPIFEPATD